MADPTTLGYEADASEVAALLQLHCGYHLTEPDPLRRYLELTRDQVVYEALAKLIRRERGRALAEMLADGTPVPEIATLTRLGTRQRVQGLLRSGRTPAGQIGEGDADGGARHADEFEPAGGDGPRGDDAGVG